MLNLTAAKFRFELVVKEPMLLPPYKGSTLRGGFGGVFRRICCSQKQLERCGDCLLKTTCPYRLIFEPGPPEGAELWGKFEEIPRPFVIEPPETEQTEFRPGEALAFDLILIGKGLDYLPYFILVFKELGGIGIGKGRAKFELTRVASLTADGAAGEIVYDGEKVYNRFPLLKPVDPQSKFTSCCDGLRIGFKTMTRLKATGEFTVQPDFTVLIRALLRRLSALQYFYCGQKLDCDFNALISRAEAVALTDNQTRWADWERYSSRQDTRMHLGGLVGEAVYNGPWREFGELLGWGEVLHVGKGATFGLGRYEIG